MADITLHYITCCIVVACFACFICLLLLVLSVCLFVFPYVRTVFFFLLFRCFRHRRHLSLSFLRERVRGGSLEVVG